MKPKRRFTNQQKSFWANVRSISQFLGYTDRRTSLIRVPNIREMDTAVLGMGLQSSHLISRQGTTTSLGRTLLAYFQHRADILNDFVEPRLMDAAAAKTSFNRLRRQLKPKCPLPMNKQKGEKRAPAYLTGIVNMIVEANIGALECDYDPRQLTTFTKNGEPFRTLSRRLDGAFPSTVNPIAVWEVKEYYHTTTFGSRIADGVYETLLDGMELEELRKSTANNTRHYLIVDAHYTWWKCGRSYLCRLVDMLHMGYVDEVLFGIEVLERLPEIVRSWASARRSRTK